ncbi:hypothetical protein ACIBAG_22575 [Streptomyces sp. NPDC051243]|uniref:hypothetical protein n=1 Tax=Streptomyces sp. NPDC051243 TaxID=3365646 RepID=UPI0037ADF86D
MDRLVHHELRAALAALLAFVICAVAVAVVRGIPTAPFGRAALYLGGLVALLAVFTLLEATRIKGVSEVRYFDAAVPVDPERALPPEDFWHDQPVSRRMFWFILVPTLPVALLWEPWVIVFPLGSALSWAGKAALVAHWERRHGRLLWRGHIASRPWELSYSPLSPPPPARTATDAPPG